MKGGHSIIFWAKEMRFNLVLFLQDQKHEVIAFDIDTNAKN